VACFCQTVHSRLGDRFTHYSSSCCSCQPARPAGSTTSSMCLTAGTRSGHLAALSANHDYLAWPARSAGGSCLSLTTPLPTHKPNQLVQIARVGHEFRMPYPKLEPPRVGVRGLPLRHTPSGCRLYLQPQGRPQLACTCCGRSGMPAMPVSTWALVNNRPRY
jgi:hypothetical protein